MADIKRVRPVPTQSRNRNGKTSFVDVDRYNFSNVVPGKVYYFAYMRKSTTKSEQEQSISQQNEGIKLIAGVKKIDIEEINFYSESRSGFENKLRPEWKKMIEAIDYVSSQGGICVLMCRDSSRLSRNPSDNLDLLNRLYGDNQQKGKRVIDRIYMLGEGNNVVEWPNKFEKKILITELHENYMSSIATKEKSCTGSILKLHAGEFPYPPPHGLERVIEKTGALYVRNQHKTNKTVLKQTSTMVYIKKAFEMKADGRTAKEISDFLKKYAAINVPPKKIVETIIQNTVYKGEYTEKTKGIKFDNIRFHNGTLPIEKGLWDKANRTIGKRGSGLGEGQKEHLFPGKIKTERDTTFQMYVAKGKSGKGQHFNYKGTSKTVTGDNINIYISENDILNFICSEIVHLAKEIFFLIGVNLIEDEYGTIHDEFKSSEFGYTADEYKGMITKKITELQSSLLHPDTPKLVEAYSLNEKKIKELEERMYKELEETCDPICIGMYQAEVYDYIEYLRSSLSTREEILKEYIEESDFMRNLMEMINFQKAQIDNLKNRKNEIEKQITTTEVDAFKKGYDRHVADLVVEELKNELIAVEKEIVDISKDSDISRIPSKIPMIIAKIVELTCNAVGCSNIKEYREDIKLLLNLIAVELIITNKKELKLKLFLCLGDLISTGNGNWSRGRELNP